MRGGRGGTDGGRPEPGPVAALLTPVGRGAIAVVGVRGPGAVEAVARCFVPCGPHPLVRKGRADAAAGESLRVGRWRGPAPLDGDGGVAPEEVLVVLETSGVVEVHCHGGLAACERVLMDLEAVGCIRLEWPEWWRDAGGDGIEWEARLALAAARGPKAAAILSHQLAGALSRRMAEIRRSLVADAAHRDTARQLLERLSAWRVLGARLTDPFLVVVTGAPNAGKSSLVNALAGFARSLVHHNPGTTRDLVSTRLVIGGWECDVVDTAGLRIVADDEVERAGVEAAVALARSADLVLQVRDATGDATPTVEWSSAGSIPDPPVVLRVLSKCDLVAGGIEGAMARSGRSDPLPLEAWIPTSALTGEGIERLADAIRASLVPREPGPGEPVPFTARQLAEIDMLLAAVGSTADGRT